MKIAISTSSFAEEDSRPLDMLKAAGMAILPNPHRRKLTETEIMVLLNGVDGLIAGVEPLNRKVLSSARSLKALARVGIGMDNVDQAAAKELGIKVSNTPEGPTAAVAELALAAMLALTRQLIPANQTLHAGEWKKSISTGLSGATVLLVGFGRIGRRVAELLTPFNAQVRVHDPFFDPASLPAGIKAVSLSEGLAAADVISLHAAGSATLLGPAEFDTIKKGAVLLNCARGSLVDEPALLAALDSGIIQSAWFDVFREEPYKGPLLRYPQVLLTPHAGTYTRACRSDMETAAVTNLLRDLGVGLDAAS